MPRRKKPRVYQPKPSAAARERILAAVRTLLADPDAGGWTAGFGVTLKQLSEVPGVGFTYSTLANYLSVLVRAGDLARVASGVYTLPPQLRA